MNRGNGNNLTITQRKYNNYSRLTINRGYWSSYTSHFGCAEIIMVNQQLSLDEIECIEDYLNDKYDIFQIATENPGQCLSNVTDLMGWYIGDSLNLTNNIWHDISGANNHGTISGSGIEVFDGNDTNSEFYLNGSKVVTGTTSTKILFKAMIVPQHTIFNVCKYKSSGTKRVILQAEAYYAAFGFYNYGSGRLYENGWVSSGSNSFGDMYLLSSSKRDMYEQMVWIYMFPQGHILIHPDLQ